MSKPLRIALFGGSFDPVHLGHVEIARAAAEALGLNLVIFIPCRQSPHKARGTAADEAERLHMLELATADLSWAEVSDLETYLPPPSYSWITAEMMHEIFPADRLFWLMGEDQWQTLDSWARPDYLADLVEFIIHSRGGTPTPNPGYRAHFIQGDHPASASVIRRDAPSRLRADWLHPEVARFIRSTGLYDCRD